MTLKMNSEDCELSIRTTAITLQTDCKATGRNGISVKLGFHLSQLVPNTV